jgi:hypothetical protein
MRKRSALMFALLAFICGGILLVTFNYAHNIKDIKYLYSRESVSQNGMIYLTGCLTFALITVFLLYSKIAIKSRLRWLLLTTSIIFAIAAVPYASLTLPFWEFPLWCLTKYAIGDEA